MDRRQEGRRKHTAEQTQTNARTDRRTDGGGEVGDGGMGRESAYSFVFLGVWGLYMTYLGGDEGSSQEHRGRGEKKRERVWLNGILAPTQLRKLTLMLVFPL